MRRRTSIIIFGGAVALPLQDADSATGPVVGFLSTALPASLASFVSAVLQGLRVCPGTSSGIAKLSKHEAD